MDKEIISHGGQIPIGRETIESGLGDINTSFANVFRGFNHHGTGSIMPDNKDNQGYIFFTRPRLNLTQDNAYASRKLRPYLSAGEASLLRAIRVYLDPVSQRGHDVNYLRGSRTGQAQPSLLKVDSKDIVDSPLVNKNSPFIHILSESLLSLQGWPDETLDVYTSEPGMMKETYSIADTYIDNYETGDLTATFRNIKGDVIPFLIRAWMEWIGRSMSGEILPWMDSVMEFEKSYETRIWRIVTDVSGRKVTKIGSAVAGIPTANPLGQTMNLDRQRPYSEDTKEISIPFKCVGFEINDPILVEEFNDTIYAFNPELENAILSGERNKYVSVPYSIIDYFKYELVMTIEEETLNLLWWAETDYYNKIIKEYQLDVE